MPTASITADLAPARAMAEAAMLPPWGLRLRLNSKTPDTCTGCIAGERSNRRLKRDDARCKVVNL